MAEIINNVDCNEPQIVDPACGLLSLSQKTGNATKCDLAPNDEDDGSGCEGKNDANELSAAQRARIERNRLKARALQDARLVTRPNVIIPAEPGKLDSGGGFLLEEEPAPPPAVRAPPAPLIDPADQPHCSACQRPFACSYLFDTFDHSVCDACRDEEGEHSLMTRTEAKSEFLLKDCDLDSRPPPLRCVRRRNPHRGGGDMRLYLRAQVEARALLVWGSRAALDAELARRDDTRARTRLKQTHRRLRALRMDVRSSLYDRTAPRHDHSFGPERYDDAADHYERTCLTCGHRETYEKM